MLHFVCFNIAIGKERYRKFAFVEMKAPVNQIDAALVALKIVKTEEQINLIVFKHGE